MSGGVKVYIQLCQNKPACLSCTLLGEPTGHGSAFQVSLRKVWHQMQNERGKTFCFRLLSCHAHFLLWLEGKSQIGSHIPYGVLRARQLLFCKPMEWQYISNSLKELFLMYRYMLDFNVSIWISIGIAGMCCYAWLSAFWENETWIARLRFSYVKITHPGLSGGWHPPLVEP